MPAWIGFPVTLLFALTYSAFGLEPGREDVACSGTRYALIMDSHAALGMFGITLQGWLHSLKRAEVDTHVFSGATTASFFKSPPDDSTCVYEDRTCDNSPPKRHECAVGKIPSLPSLLRTNTKYVRQIVIVGLGTNQTQWKETEVLEPTTRLAREILETGSRCIWIGPPNMPVCSKEVIDRTYSFIDRSLKAAAEQVPGARPCELIDSRPISKYPNGIGDGIHYVFENYPQADKERGNLAAVSWANGVIEGLKSSLARP
jgi:hypothetical protein